MCPSRPELLTALPAPHPPRPSRFALPGAFGACSSSCGLNTPLEFLLGLGYSARRGGGVRGNFRFFAMSWSGASLPMLHHSLHYKLSEASCSDQANWANGAKCASAMVDSSAAVTAFRQSGFDRITNYYWAILASKILYSSNKCGARFSKGWTRYQRRGRRKYSRGCRCVCN